MLSAAKELFKQLLKKPATNPFPTKRVPKNVSELLEGSSKKKINKPVAVPQRFRGRLLYFPEKCIRCRQCIRVCPAAALEFDEKNNVIVHYVARCTFCGQCVDICPVKALEQTSEFLLSTYDKNLGFAEPNERNGKEKHKK